MQKLKQLEESLENIGLLEKEKTVYITLFRLGGSGFPSAIAKEAKLNRSTTYKTLTSLSIKGLVHDLERNKKVFYTLAKPEKLLGYIEYQNKELTKKVTEVKKLIPDLSALFSVFGVVPKISIFEGYKEVKEIYFDMIKYKSYEMLAVFNAREFEGYLTKEEQRTFTRGKLSQKISMRAIVPDDEYGTAFASKVYGFMKGTKYFPEIKKISKEKFPFASEFTMYGKNKIAMFKLLKEGLNKQVIGVVIEDEVFYGMMKMIFELSWQGASIEKVS